MALGGGTWLTQNKVLPGAYMNFVSVSRATATLSDRGYAAMPVVLDWGVDGEVFTVTNDEFQKYSSKLFGYSYIATEIKGLRDLFLSAKECHFYKLNTGGVKASCNLATALYTGIRGNEITIIVEANEDWDDSAPVYDVTTMFDGLAVDEQTGIMETKQLADNDYVKWKASASLTMTAGMPLTGGTNGTVTAANHQVFLDKIEAFNFNTLGLVSTDETLKGLYANFTKRMRDEVGVKFQTVLYRYSGYDYEGVISVENKLVGELGDNTDSAALVYWATGAEAGCAVNRSLTNATYSGEYNVNVDYTQKQLENGIKGGNLMFHKVNDVVRVLEDINTFVSFTDDKNVDFSSNQTMRVLDQIGNDIAALFKDKYLGKVPNDAAGRVSLWNDIVKHHQELERLRSIEDFDPDKLLVEKGDSKKAVLVTDYVTPVNAMAQLYMTVWVK